MSHRTQHNYTMSIKSEVFELLSHHQLSPDLLLVRLEGVPSITLQNENKENWTFVMRHRCKRYLMAKTAEMKKYEEIYCKTY
jgi:hypothetical protein